jgi:two-component system, cell cycle sensor histidine kinase and response regulator CckA
MAKDALREKAEELHSLRPKKGRSRDTDRLIQELDVHQIELEMQNEEIKRSQLVTEESQKKYLELYDLAPVGYLTLDEKGIMSELNLAVARFLGVAKQSLVDKPLHEFIKSEFQDLFHIHRQEVLESSTTQTCELMLRKNDGTFFHGRLDSVRAEIKGQRIIHTILTDTTDRKRIEEALQIARESLELRVQERTAELRKTRDELELELAERKRVEGQLRQSQKMEAIGTFAGGIAHDFNNILAAILGFTEMAIEDAVDDPANAKKSLNHVLKSTLRAKDLVKKILSFSRKAEYERNPMSVYPVVKETILLLKSFIPTNINVSSTMKAASDTVLASPIEIQQIIMNLSANAAHAMESGGSIMEVSLTDITFQPDSPDMPPDLKPGEYVQLAIRDDGIGMSPEVKERIFEPFFTTKGVGKGTGMGLSVVYGIVKGLYGDITVESKPGTGSTFRVFLPKISTAIKPEPAHGELPRGDERILFVDDESILAEWGQTVFERLGYKVHATIDSADALGTFSADPYRFDIVITDQAMPRMTGAQLSKKILEIRKDMPIILCTGHSDSLSPDEAKKLGIGAFLMKPLGRQELARAVREALDAKKESVA